MRPVLRYQVVVILLLAIHAALLAWGALCHSPSIDEVGHLPSGLGHWQQGRFDLYHVNPPLVRMVAALPVLANQPRVDWSDPQQYYTHLEFGIGRTFIAENGERSFWYFTLARWALIPFGLLGGYICWRWSCELFGPPAGLLSLTMWCFSPLVLGNAQMITPDTSAAALGVTAQYLFWRWLKAPGWGVVLLAGLCLGLTELTKFTWVILFLLWPALWFAWRWPQRDLDGRSWLRQGGQLAVMLLLALFLINVCYAFDGSFRPLKKYSFSSLALTGRDPSNKKVKPWEWSSNRFRGTLLGEMPVPFPRAYLMGIDRQKMEFENGYWSYLRGEWRFGGWWYYYLYGLAVKVPLGTWMLVLVALGLALTRSDCRAVRRDELFLLVPLVLILALVSSQTGFNHHLRYVLPIFPFAFILISRVGQLATKGAAWLRVTSGAALGWSVAASLVVYPHSLAYFNELAGGPANGGRHLVDSNLDWGQDLLLLRDWLRKHSEAQPLGFVYFGAFDPRVAGIEFTLPPPGPISSTDTAGSGTALLGPRPGWYAVSATILHGYHFSVPNGQGMGEDLKEDYYTYFQRFEPVARAGYSINIYHITPEQADRVRSELGLPPLLPTVQTDSGRSFDPERSAD